MSLLLRLGSILAISTWKAWQLITWSWIPSNRVEITSPLFSIELRSLSMSLQPSFSNLAEPSETDSNSTSISIFLSARLTPVILHSYLSSILSKSSTSTKSPLAMQLKKMLMSSSVISRQTSLTKLEKSFLVSLLPSLLRILVRLRFLVWRFMRKLLRMKVILVEPSLVKFLRYRSPKILCVNIFSQSQRVASSMQRQPKMKSRMLSLTSTAAGMATLRLRISSLKLSRLFLLLNSQGILPTSSSQVITPIDQMSHLYVYLSSFRICGAMYAGVPTVVFSRLFVYKCFANPKSAIFSDYFRIRIFSGFRSRWITPFFTSSPKPLRIWMRQPMVIFSEKAPFLLMMVRRVPSAFSSTMQKLFLVSWTSRNMMMLGHLSFFMIFISEQKAFRVYSSCSITDLATTLIATGSLLSSIIPLYTFENAPWPSSSFWNIMYFPILFFELIPILLFLLIHHSIQLKYLINQQHSFVNLNLPFQLLKSHTSAPQTQSALGN